ncbi:MAG: SGNH/GDSL hydrolase family protein [Nitrospina sp.]|jgi:hypothetical protein|nr:SGNH/GDSL hydrolase family protein [Nitrospina sp.]
MNVIKNIVSYGLILFITLVLFEFCSYVLTLNGFFWVNDIPGRYLKGSKLTTTAHYSWRTEREDWGAWHLPGASTIHSTSCFSARYESNEAGARDDSFADITGLTNVVLLGDSFAEGYGVNFEDTAQRIIEHQTGFNLLNFGVTGHFGPVQYYTIYEKLAKSYPHEALVIFFLPQNDFTDNDYNVWRGNGSTFINDARDERYRPYYKIDNDGNLGSFIPQNAVKRDDFGSTKELWEWRSFLVENFWLSNAWRTAHFAIKGRANKNAGAERRYTGYFDATENQQKVAMEYVNKLVQVAQDKPVLIVAIPTADELRRLKEGFDLSRMYWWNYLRDFASNNANVEFLDLSSPEVDSIERLFHTCDEHWSAYGNKWAAEKISPKLTELINR